MKEQAINELIQSEGVDAYLISDGYHTFRDLYDIRLAYNAALFNEWANQFEDEKKGYVTVDDILESKKKVKYNVHKSWRHHDGELCFGGGWFIVTAQLPNGQISNHYEGKYWDLFKIPEADKALFPFDGHNTKQVIDRLIELSK